MRNAIYILFLTSFLLAGCSHEQNSPSPSVEELHRKLDKEIENSHTYELQKIARIDELRNKLPGAGDDEKKKLYDRLIEEYESYQGDSALIYIDKAIAMSRASGDSVGVMDLVIKRSDLLAHAGLFHDALETMSQLRRDAIPETLIDDYYEAYNLIYQYLCEYAEGSGQTDSYEAKRELYADSLRQVVAPGSFNYAVYCIPSKARRGKEKEAIEELIGYLDRYESGDRRYSILTSIAADLCKNAGRTEEYERYIALSGISDVQGVIKENMSFRENANCAFAEGDVERANRYLKKSFTDANFFSARMRKDQSSQILPAIDSAYTEIQQRLQTTQRSFIIAVSLLAIFLTILIIITLRQKVSLRKANERLNAGNEELSKISAQLKEANSQLEATNRRLAEANSIKEQYAGLFMETCSSAINTLMQNHNQLKVLATQSGVTSKIARKLESTEMIDKTLRDFYSKFDEAILSIYPTFPESVNALLREDERISLKSNERLNTELRVLALIRLGISDNDKIAQFLRCSITTVYTYRSKLRKRSLNPEAFESQVKAIDAV